MSKRLAKILSICALVVLMPFIIVGSALAFTQAVGVTLTIAQGGINSTLGIAEPTIAIVINNQVQEQDSIEVKKNTSVNLSYEGEGYHFYGWYEGNTSEIDVTKDIPLANGAEDIQGYVVNGNKTLTAMRDVQTYNVTYSGNDANGNPITLEKDNGLEYGAELEVLPGNAAKIFSGWAVKDSTEAPTRVAKFAATTQGQEVEVVPVWKENASYKVYYSIVDNTDANAVSLTYTVTNGFSAYTKTRTGYDFAGIYFNDKLYVDNGANDYVYNGEKLSEALANPANSTVVLSAAWKSIYPSINIYYAAQAKYTMGGVTGDYVLVDAQGKFAETVGTTDDKLAYVQYTIDDKAGIDYTDDIHNYFFGGKTLKTNNAEAKTASYSGKIRIVATDQTTGAENSYSILDATGYTFGDIFKSIYDRYNQSGVLTKDIQLIFEYKVA